MIIHDVTSHDVTYLYVNLYINVNLSIKPFPQTLGDTLVPFFSPGTLQQFYPVGDPFFHPNPRFVPWSMLETSV